MTSVVDWSGCPPYSAAVTIMATTQSTRSVLMSLMVTQVCTFYVGGSIFFISFILKVPRMCILNSTMIMHYDFIEHTKA